MNFKEELGVRTDEVRGIIETYLPAAEGFQEKLIQAMNYSMQAGGKCIRPMLMAETYRMFGGKSKIIEPFMAAIEMIHTHSLVHDDLPAIDNDEYRRGRKTTHIVFGETMGILAGDGLLNLAYETASLAFEMEPENHYIGRAMGILAKKTGIYGMLGGQAVDVEAAGLSISKEKLDFIYRLKTGALVEASMMIGAVLAGADRAEMEAAGSIAADIGLAFQIQDDILDVSGTMEVLGKPIHSDEKNQKTTYVTLKGITAAKEDVEKTSNRAIETLDSLKTENQFLKDLIINLMNREK